MNKATLIRLLGHLNEEDEIGVMVYGQIKDIDYLVVERSDNAQSTEYKIYLTYETMPSVGTITIGGY